MYRDLTKGNITKTLLIFALPMIAGNMLQQFYNIADTLIVGRFLGRDALAAVGSAYSLMTFLTSAQIGLSMGAGALFSIYKGRQDTQRLEESITQSFELILLVTAAMNILVYVFLDPIMHFLSVPPEVYEGMRAYLTVILAGMAATFLYNYYACLLRALGNSALPLVFLAISAALNIVLDLVFVIVFKWGIEGAAIATVIAQYVSGLGIAAYTYIKNPALRLQRRYMPWKRDIMADIGRLSVLTCIQQSVMNFGILMIQGLVNSFGAVTMAAFAAAVKIDSFAYMPVQDFGNAFSTFVAQNYGAGEEKRIREGVKKAGACAVAFCLISSSLVFVFARPLMLIFVQAHEVDIIACGVNYLRIEGAFYWGIGLLFLLYGFYRAVKRPSMSLVLTVISLGTRVLLAYTLAGAFGVTAIWAAIPIGWVLADAAGIGYYLKNRDKLLKQ